MSPTLTATLRAVDYLRVSTEEQAKGYGITAAAKKTVPYIARKDWDHVGTFKDEGVSGSLESSARPDLKRLMALARQVPRPFDVVVVPESRAIGRTDRAFWRWVWELEDLGVFVADAKTDIDNTTDAGKDAMREEANYAFKEYNRIRSRTQSGIQEKAEEGGWPGGPTPFGWRIENQGKKKLSRPAVDDVEAATLRRMRDLRVQRKSFERIAFMLNIEGLPTRQELQWTEKNVRRVLRSESVTKAQATFRKPSTAKLAPTGGPIHGPTVVIALPAIFTDEERAELITALDHNLGHRTPQRGAAVYPASGRVTALCGGVYTGYRRKGRPGRLYRCTSTCSCPQMDADALEGRIWKSVCALLSDPEQLEVMAQDWVALTEGQRVNYAERLEALAVKIEDQEAAIALTMTVAAKQATQRRLDPQAAEAAVERAVKPLGEELVRLEQEQADVAAWRAEGEAAESRARDLQTLARVARTHLYAMSPLDQREVLQLLDLRVRITGPVPKRPAAGSPVAWFVERDRTVPDLTDAAWAVVEPLITASDSGRGPERMPVRGVLTAILLKASTGMTWEELPAEYGKPGSIRQRWNRWVKSGIWAQIMDALIDAPGRTPGILPPMEAEGRLDPRSLIGTAVTPMGTGSIEPVPSSAIPFHISLAA